MGYKAISCHRFLSIPPANIRKPQVFWYFQKVLIETSGMKWVNTLMIFRIKRWCHWFKKLEIYIFKSNLVFELKHRNLHFVHNFDGKQDKKNISKQKPLDSQASAHKNLTVTESNFPSWVYLFKMNNGNNRTMCEICSNVTMLTIVFIVNSEQIPYIALVFPLLTLNKWMPAGLPW